MNFVPAVAGDEKFTQPGNHFLAHHIILQHLQFLQETSAALTVDTGIFQGLSSHSSGNTERPIDRYRHSVISFPRGGGRLSVPRCSSVQSFFALTISVLYHREHRGPFCRGSIVANHLSIRKEAIGEYV